MVEIEFLQYALLLDIKEAIMLGKPSGPQARMFRRPNIVVAVKIRGFVTLVQNSHKEVHLAAAL